MALLLGGARPSGRLALHAALMLVLVQNAASFTPLVRLTLLRGPTSPQGSGIVMLQDFMNRGRPTGALCAGPLTEQLATTLCTDTELATLGYIKGVPVTAASLGQGSTQGIARRISCPPGATGGPGTCTITWANRTFDCGAEQLSAVKCLKAQQPSGAERLRLLRGGASRIPMPTRDLKGQPEFRNGSTWMAMCGDRFTDAAAEVVCRQLGHLGGRASPPAAPMKSGSKLIGKVQVACNGGEMTLTACPARNLPQGVEAGKPSPDCPSGLVASVTCRGVAPVMG